MALPTTLRPFPDDVIVTITDWPPFTYWTTASVEPLRFIEGQTPAAMFFWPEPFAFMELMRLGVCVERLVAMSQIFEPFAE